MKNDKYQAISIALKRMGMKIPLTNAYALIKINELIRVNRFLEQVTKGWAHAWEWWTINIIDRME